MPRGDEMGNDEEQEDEDESEEDEASGRVGVVYQVSKGRLMKLDGGMRQYEEKAAKASAKLGKT